MNTIKFNAPTPVTRFAEPVKYGIAAIVGLYMGTGGVPEFARGIIYLVMGVYCIFLAFQKNLDRFFAFIPYFIYSEIIIRANETIVPNIFAEYTMLACFAALFISGGTKFKIYSISFAFVFLYAIIELFDSVRSTNPNFARIAIVNSLLLSVIALWSASNKISIKHLNTLMLNFKIASIFLTFCMLAKHIFGHVDYSSQSSFQSTNGLAPVQVSAYLGLGTVLFFLSLVNPLEKRKIALHLLLFSVSCLMMILSFSRGGLYFLAVIIILYLLFNRQNLGSYFLLFMLAPIGFIIYYYVTEATGGLIVDRYQQEGSSGRDVLVMAGITIFRQDPLAGIGTGNFSTEIVARGLYDQQSGAHNDFVRAIAEHGILGIVTYWFFYISMFIEMFRKKGAARQYAVYFFALFCLIIVHNGLKISLQHVLLVFIICQPMMPEKNTKKPLPGIAANSSN